MGLGGALSRCKAVFGDLSRVVPGAVRPAASKAPVKTGYHAKITLRPAPYGLNASPSRTVLSKAKMDDSVEVTSFPGTLPRLDVLESAPALKKLPERVVTEASREEEDVIQAMWGICSKVLDDQLKSDAAVMELQFAQRAAPAGVSAVWPFAGSNSHITNLACCKYSISDLLHAAFHQQRVQHILPLVQELLLASTIVHPNQCPLLHETLSLLVELYPHAQLSRDDQDVIASILGRWGLQPKPMSADFLVWTDEQPTSWWNPGMEQPDCFLPGNGFVLFGVGQLQQPRSTIFNPFPTALQLPTQPNTNAATSNSTQHINPDTQNGLVTQAAMAAAVQAARQEEQQKAKAALDKAHAEGLQAVAHAMREGRTATKRAVAYAIARSKLDKTDKIHVFETLSEQPSDIFMVKAYYERHTNVFHFDFNERMRQRRRERLTAESMSTEEFDDSGAVDE